VCLDFVLNEVKEENWWIGLHLMSRDKTKHKHARLMCLQPSCLIGVGVVV